MHEITDSELRKFIGVSENASEEDARRAIENKAKAILPELDFRNQEDRLMLSNLIHADMRFSGFGFSGSPDEDFEPGGVHENSWQEIYRGDSNPYRYYYNHMIKKFVSQKHGFRGFMNRDHRHVELYFPAQWVTHKMFEEITDHIQSIDVHWDSKNNEYGYGEKDVSAYISLIQQRPDLLNYMQSQRIESWDTRKPFFEKLAMGAMLKPMQMDVLIEALKQSRGSLGSALKGFVNHLIATEKNLKDLRQHDGGYDEEVLFNFLKVDQFGLGDQKEKEERRAYFVPVMQKILFNEFPESSSLKEGRILLFFLKHFKATVPLLNDNDLDSGSLSSQFRTQLEGGFFGSCFVTPKPIQHSSASKNVVSKAKQLVLGGGK